MRLPQVARLPCLVSRCGGMSLLLWLPLAHFGWNTGRSGLRNLGLLEFGVFKRRLEILLARRVLLLLVLHFELEQRLLISDYDVINIFRRKHMQHILALICPTLPYFARTRSEVKPVTDPTSFLALGYPE